jgi:transcription initiation factor TFIIIB Brf1 subunit/transcription initiation factor TFIIB
MEGVLYAESFEAKSAGKSRRSILTDMEGIPLTDDIKNKAESIYKNMTSSGVNRKRKRKYVVFYCLYEAHRELHLTVDPRALAQSIGLSKGDVTKAVSMCSPMQTGYRPVAETTSPLQVIPILCEKFSISQDALRSIIDTGTRVLSNDSGGDDRLMESSPLAVAAGIIKYHFDINGVPIKGKEFASTVSFSEATINQMVKRISLVDNKGPS